MTKTQKLVYGISVAVVILVCFLVFLICYRGVYDTDSGAGFIPPCVAAYFYFLCSIGVLIGAGIAVWVIMEKRVKLWAMLLITLVLPIVCYVSNYHLYKPGGTLFCLVARGGPFYCVAANDFNYNGRDDEDDRQIYQREKLYSTHRTIVEKEYNYDAVTPMIEKVSYEVTGVGRLENVRASFKKDYEGHEYITLSYDQSFTPTTYEKIVLDCILTSEGRSKEVTDIFTMETKNKRQIEVPVEFEYIDDYTVRVIFDQETLERHKDKIQLSIYIKVDYDS